MSGNFSTMESTREQVKNLALDLGSYGFTLVLSTVTRSCKINVCINTVTDPEDWFILRKLSLSAEEPAEMTRHHGFSSLHKLLVLAKGIIK